MIYDLFKPNDEIDVREILTSWMEELKKQERISDYKLINENGKYWVEVNPEPPISFVQFSQKIDFNG